MIEVNWKQGLAFEAVAPSGHRLALDGEGAAPSPMEALLAAVAACSGMDILSILEKKRQEVSAYRIEIEASRPPDGEWPRPYVAMTIRHILTGENLDPVAVQRAVELSDGKYCSVMATLRQTPTISSEWRIEP